MRFDDPRSVLRTSAAKPSAEVDVAAVMRHGVRLRRIRVAAATVGVAVLVGVATTATWAFDTDGGPPPAPAAPAERACEDPVGASRDGACTDRDALESHDRTPPVRAIVELRRAECSLEPPRYVEGAPASPEKWCTFRLLLENVTAETIALDRNEARLVLEGGPASTTYSTAFHHRRSSPVLADASLAPGERVRERLVFLVDVEEVPVALVLRPILGGRIARIALDYDCPAALVRPCTFATGS